MFKFITGAGPDSLAVNIYIYEYVLYIYISYGYWVCAANILCCTAATGEDFMSLPLLIAQ